MWTLTRRANRRPSALWRGCAAAVFALAAMPLYARTVTLEAERVSHASVVANGVRVALTENGDAGSLVLTLKRLEIPALGLADPVAWRCSLSKTAKGRECGGRLALAGNADAPAAAELHATVTNDTVDLRLTRAAAGVLLSLPLHANAPTRIALMQVPASMLQRPLAAAWPAGEFRDGVVVADAAIAPDGAVDVRYGLAEATFGSVDGAWSATGLDSSGTLHLENVSTAPKLRATAKLSAGRLNVGATSVQLPDEAVDLDLDIAAGDGTWNVAAFRWADADTLVASASGIVAPADATPLRELSARVERATFPLAMERYGASALAARGVAPPRTRGALSGELALKAGALDRLAVSFDGFDASDGKRFSARGLAGAFDWSATEEPPATTLRWKSLAVDALSIRSGKAELRTNRGIVQLAKPLGVPALGGQVVLKRLAFDPRVDQRLSASAEFDVRSVGYDSADGTIAASKVSIGGRAELGGTIAAPSIRLDADFEGGEFLYGPVYIKLPSSPVHASLDAARDGETWRIAKFDWNDSGVLEIGGKADIAPHAARPFPTVDLELRKVALAPALERYAQSWLAAKGYPDLHAAGRLEGALGFGRDGLERFAFSAHGVELRDGAGRFAFAGVDGGVDWRHGGKTSPTTLGWSAIELFKLPLGAAKAKLRSEDDAIELAAPVEIGVLGGKVRLEKLSLEPRSPRGERYAASLAIAGIEMAQLSDFLGWPRFPGNLSGGIPEIEFAGDTIELHGGLDIYVFDGYLGVSGMRLERPFGVAPSLEADIHFENFDLEQLTGAFSFGSMSGRLHGNVRELRLVDFAPVAFDASLRSDGGRMSYKAVNDLTALGGGGGLSSSLQTMALKIFDTFGYRRLGLRCRLAADVCTMGGVDAAFAAASGEADSGGDHYTIVEGSGLPRIEIVGHRRRVDWPTLVERLVEATRGQGPVIR